MKYYSDVTKKLYDSEADLEAAEKEAAELEEKKRIEREEKEAKERIRNEERKIREKEVQDAFDAASKASSEANEKLRNFIKDYGYCSVKSSSKYPTLNGITDFLFPHIF